MILVGIDIAKRVHNATIINDQGNVLFRSLSFKNDKDGFLKLLNHIQNFSKKTTDVVIGMESTSHYWIALHDQLVKLKYKVHVINPIQSNALRNIHLRKNKSDPVDSLLIAETIRYGHFSPSQVLENNLLSLRELTRQRFYLVDINSDLKRKITALIDQVFPEYETFFSDMFCSTSIQVLLHYPTPSKLKKANSTSLEKLLLTASNQYFGLEKAHQMKEISKNSFGSTTIEDSIGFLIKNHVSQLLELRNRIKGIDKKIDDDFQKINSPITSIPGIGNLLGAVIVSEIGDISRFSNLSKLVAFAGIDPIVRQSGDFIAKKTHMSKRGSPYLRRALWLSAGVAIHSDPILRKLYDKKRLSGKSHMTTLGHICRKLLSIIYAVLRDNKSYEPPLV